MDKLRVGIIVHPDDEPADGGKFSYFHTLLEGINNFDFYRDIEIINIVFYKENYPTIHSKNLAYL